MGRPFLSQETLDRFDRETQAIFSYPERFSFDVLPISKTTNMYLSNQRPKTRYSTVHDSAGYPDHLEPQNMGRLTGVATNTASDSHLSSLQQWDFVDAPPDQRAFLAPENYSTMRKGSLGTDTVSSQFAWSTASNADVLSNSPHLSSFGASIGSDATTPFMKAYDPSNSLQQTMNSSGMSGYTSQQIDQWCTESDPTGDFYQFPPFPTIGSIIPEPYNAFSSPNEQWLSVPGQNQPFPTDPIPETFFSVAPRSTPSQNTSLHHSTTTTVSITSSPPHSFSDPESPPPPSSASNASDLSNYGIPTGDGTWRCAHPGCSSQSTFRRGCDLRKHFNRHQKYLFCRHEGCPQSMQRGSRSTQNGFSSKKDRIRHEAKHNPGVFCEWEGCGRVFSRVDNMKDHVKRIHLKGEARRG
jgi:hypothetical protein